MALLIPDIQVFIFLYELTEISHWGISINIPLIDIVYKKVVVKISLSLFNDLLVIVHVSFLSKPFDQSLLLYNITVHYLRLNFSILELGELAEKLS